MSKQFVLNGVAAFLPEKNRIIAINSDRAPLSLSMPASHCLSLLIHHQGRVVLRDDFFQEVWLNNGAQVTNNTFYQNISILRRAFKEFGLHEEYIVTVPKVGIKLEDALQITCSEDELPANTEPSIAADTKITPPQPLNISLRREAGLLRKKWFGVSALGIILCLGTVIISWQESMDKRFTQFKPLISQNGCRYFVNPDTSDYKKHRSFVSDMNFNCEVFTHVYLTAYNNFARFSALACDRPFSAWRKNHCVVHYFITDNSNVS